ncbi:MAG TPA: GIY-YIG nuclease family protein [bacterium]|nr:GIY-YIG nuclease family protein [bacterium]
MEEIKLVDVLRIERPKEYKAHFAMYNKKNEPLDVFVRDQNEWKGWTEYRPSKNDFNRRYIFSVMSFYHEKDVWLFGGIWEVLERNGSGYKIKLTLKGEEYIGRLKLKLKLSGRQPRIKFESVYENLVVSEILKERYTGETFSSYENIDLMFSKIITIIKNEKPDWKAALGSVKGVYLITDTSKGKRYVGSAYGDVGIWSRWRQYVETGHGGNDALKKLITEKGFEYALRNFKFTLLEYRSMKVDDQEVIDRESFWKKALLSRGDLGYNGN